MMKIPSLKSKSKKTTIISLPDPAVFYMPLRSFSGLLKPLVSVGDQVKKFQLLALAEGPFASRLHAPASGKIEAFVHFGGSDFIQLRNDFKTEEIPEETCSDTQEFSPTEIISRVTEAGIEGAGGATFPTHIKYKGAGNIHTFIVNAAECEPYLSADYAMLSQHTRKIFRSLQLIKKTVNPERFVIGLERQHRELVPMLQGAFRDFDLYGSVQLLPDEYPQGGELQLIRSVTGKELPKGSIPSDEGILVNNVGTLWAIYQAVFHNQPSISRVLTISGENATRIGNFEVKIGTPISFLLKEINQQTTTDQTLILGGPMMGKAVTDLRTPVHKGSGGLLLINHKKQEAENCIHCGYCADVCPQRLLPMEFARPSAMGSTEKLRELNLTDCIECGACAYICPSNLPLMPAIFKGKDQLSKSLVR